MTEAFGIMFVCTANQCRSPMAERIARSAIARRLGTGSPFQVWSAGTRAVDGIPMTPTAVETLTERDVPADGFLSSELRVERLEAAGVVLTLERRHRSRVVEVAPGVLKRAFTISEFARVATKVAESRELPADPVERARALVPEAAKQRGMWRPAQPEDDDIADPIGQPIEVYRGAADLITAAVEASLTALTGKH